MRQLIQRSRIIREGGRQISEPTDPDYATKHVVADPILTEDQINQKKSTLLDALERARKYKDIKKSKIKIRSVLKELWKLENPLI